MAPSKDYDNHHHRLTDGQIEMICFSAFAVVAGAYKLHLTIYEDGHEPIDHY
jgi:hypothetical protein